MVNPELLQEDLAGKIYLGRELLERLSNNELKRVQGVAKLEKKVRQELKFLEKFECAENFSKLKKEHISCSNLVHLASIIAQIFLVENPISVMQPFNLWNSDGLVVKKVVVDIVCDKGQTWLKVVARNPRALDLNSQGGNQFGQKSILDQVKEFVKCASQNPVLFSAPTVRFVFANGVTPSLIRKIEKRGATVGGEIVRIEGDDDENDSDYDTDDSESEFSSSDEDLRSDVKQEHSEDKNVIEGEVDTSRLNLDITAMIAYVSALTNGRNWFQFKEKILGEQAQWERDRPVKPFLDQVFTGKQLICCQSAMRDFKTIINTLGGPGERQRADDLINRINVVEDCDSPRTVALGNSGKIKGRSRSIFGTGDKLKVLTVTANTGFIRASQGQGVSFAVITHESRALTEDKEKLAVNLNQEMALEETL